MAITSYATYKARQANPAQQPFTGADTLSVATAVVGRAYSLWLRTLLPGAAPGAAAAPTNATAGALAQADGTLLRVLRLAGSARASTSLLNSPAFPRVILADRLSHQSGLSGTAVGAQTTNLPTAALTRYTDGVGVRAAVEIYTLVGATPQTFTCSYTNQAGTGGQTSVASAIGGAGSREAGRLMPIPLAAGDTGVRAVASLTLSGSTGAVGDFGVTLYRPLLSFALRDSQNSVIDPLIQLGGALPQILNGACLFWIIVPPNTDATSDFGMDFALNED